MPESTAARTIGCAKATPSPCSTRPAAVRASSASSAVARSSRATAASCQGARRRPRARAPAPAHGRRRAARRAARAPCGRAPPRPARAGQPRRIVGDKAALARPGEQRTHEQRGAAGRVAAGLAERLGGVGVQLGADEGGHRRRAERLELQAFGQRVRGQPPDQLALRSLLARARGSDDRHRQLVDPLGQVEQEAQRWHVAPMGVVDRDEHGCPLGQVGGQPVQPVEPREVALVRHRPPRRTAATRAPRLPRTPAGRRRRPAARTSEAPLRKRSRTRTASSERWPPSSRPPQPAPGPRRAGATCRCPRHPRSRRIHRRPRARRRTARRAPRAAQTAPALAQRRQVTALPPPQSTVVEKRSGCLP